MEASAITGEMVSQSCHCVSWISAGGLFFHRLFFPDSLDVFIPDGIFFVSVLLGKGPTDPPGRGKAAPHAMAGEAFFDSVFTASAHAVSVTVSSRGKRLMVCRLSGINTCITDAAPA